MDKINLWLWLESKNISKKTKVGLYNIYGSIENIYNADRESIESSGLKISSKYIDKLCDKTIENDELLNKFEFLKIKPVSIDMEEYPQILKQTENPPVVIYCRGKFINLNEKMCVSVVGSRKMSVYGKNVAYNISKQMAQKGAVIVSGMAYGIDTMAHNGALDADMPTVAVLGCGVDTVYPKANKGLMDKIMETGMVISEYPMGTAPLAFNFPERNKIVAGLSVATVVIEADIKSGSLITAELAKKYGRDVYAVPGNIDSVYARGTNYLIQNGAGLVTCGEDIIKNYPQHNQKLVKKEVIQKPVNNVEKGSPIEEKILNCLGTEPVSIDVLSNISGIDIAVLNSKLLIMEIQGKIAKHPGNRYSINEGRI